MLHHAWGLKPDQEPWGGFLVSHRFNLAPLSSWSLFDFMIVGSLASEAFISKCAQPFPSFKLVLLFLYTWRLVQRTMVVVLSVVLSWCSDRKLAYLRQTVEPPTWWKMWIQGVLGRETRTMMRMWCCLAARPQEIRPWWQDSRRQDLRHKTLEISARRSWQKWSRPSARIILRARSVQCRTQRLYKGWSMLRLARVSSQ